MYIAFKWLALFTWAMWLMLCGIDVIVKRKMEYHCTGNSGPQSKLQYKNKNNLTNILLKDEPEMQTNGYILKGFPFGHGIFNYFTFIAGAITVLAFNRKNEIFFFMRNNFAKINLRATMIKVTRNLHLKSTAAYSRAAITKYSIILCEILKQIANSIRFPKLKMHDIFSKFNQAKKRQNLNILLLEKLKEIEHQRNNLGQLLIAAIKENKNIRLRFQLETMAKNRLSRHLEATQKEMKENRSRYVSFQHLYIVTHQENIFLKARIKKLTKEKEIAENNLMVIMSEVYNSKENELKAFCGRLLVHTKENSINSNVGVEIQNILLRKSHYSTASTSNRQLNDQPNIEVNITKSWHSTSITELIPEDGSMHVGMNGPRLRGLPGEYVWTVKDKDGIIEKLYEYDFGYSFDNGDTIKRIRQYSVYHDKNCLLDIANSRTVLSRTEIIKSRSQEDKYDLEFRANEKFLTGSEVFQKFLQNNGNKVTSRAPPSPPLLCG